MSEPKRLGFQSTWHPNPQVQWESWLFKAGSAMRLLCSPAPLPGGLRLGWVGVSSRTLASCTLPRAQLSLENWCHALSAGHFWAGMGSRVVKGVKKP